MKIVGILLAAGLSSRMGRVKPLLPWGGGLLLEKVIENARNSRLTCLIVVLGHEADSIRQRIDFKQTRVIVNSDYRMGQSSSLRAGLSALPDDTDAAMFLLGDQPLVTAEIIDRLIGAFEKRRSPLIIPTCQGKRGNPVLANNSIFDLIQNITGDTGARALFRSLNEQIREVELSDPGILLDIDTMEEYRRLAGSTFDPKENEFPSLLL